MVKVGDTQTVTARLGENEVFEFANSVNDRNKLHMDPAYAESARFGERIVHGTLAEGVISAAHAAFDGDVIYLSKRIDFVSPVYLGDTVHGTVEIVERSGDNGYVCDVEATVDDRVVITGKEEVLIE